MVIVDRLRLVVHQFVEAVLETLPRVLAALVFLALAFVLIRVVQLVVQRAVRKVYPVEADLIGAFASLVVGVVLWFGAALMLLDILGMGQIAASLGTAAGFAALGVSYALSNMLADAVAGIYLLRDPDFMPGDTVTTDGTTGEVAEIGLRKSRLRLADGDVVVLANRDVEKRWTKAASGPDESTAGGTTNDESTADESTKESPSGASPSGESTTNESANGDAAIGDSTTGDSTNGDSINGEG